MQTHRARLLATFRRLGLNRKLMPLGASSKINAEWDFLRHLFEIGRDTAGQWIETSYDLLGERSTVDIRAMFQGLGAQHHG